MLPYLRRAWHRSNGEACPQLPSQISDSLMDAFLSACRLHHPSGVNNTDTIITDTKAPQYLRISAAIQQSISLRMMGRHSRSDAILRDTLATLPPLNRLPDTRLHCLYGRLLLSKAENAILRHELDDATDAVAGWSVRNGEPTMLELKLVRQKNTVIGRLSRYKGQFPDAQQSLEECLRFVRRDATRYHLMYHLGDVYCELGHLSKVEELVGDEVAVMRRFDKRRGKPFWRLGLPLAEAFVLQRRLTEAKPLLLEIIISFEDLDGPDDSDQLGHVRSMLCISRVYWYQSQWVDTRNTLQKAMSLAMEYSTFADGNFYIGIIHLFLCAVNFKLGGHSEQREAFLSANSILPYQAPRHYMPGMGSYFLTELKNMVTNE